MFLCFENSNIVLLDLLLDFYKNKYFSYGYMTNNNIKMCIVF